MQIIIEIHMFKAEEYISDCNFARHTKRRQMAILSWKMDFKKEHVHRHQINTRAQSVWQMELLQYLLSVRFISMLICNYTTQNGSFDVRQQHIHNGVTVSHIFM